MPTWWTRTHLGRRVDQVHHFRIQSEKCVIGRVDLHGGRLDGKQYVKVENISRRHKQPSCFQCLHSRPCLLHCF